VNLAMARCRWIAPLLGVAALLLARGAIAAVPPPPPGLGPAVAAVRDDRFADAADILAALDPATLPEASRPARDLLLGYCLSETGEDGGAYPLLEGAAAAFPAVAATFHYRAAVAALDERRFDWARASLDRLFALPESRLTVPALRLKARVEKEAGDRQAALAALDRYLAFDGGQDDVGALFDKAGLQAEVGAYRQAQATYQQVWIDYPSDDLAAAAVRAQRSLERHAPIPCAGAEDLYARAQRAARAYHHEEVIRSVHLLARRAPNFAQMDQAELLCGRAEDHLHRLDRAAATFERAAIRFPQSPLVAEYLYREAQARLRLREVDRATRLASALAHRFPQDPNTGLALYMLGKHHHLRGEPEVARQWLGRLVQLQPKGGQTDVACWRLGWIAYQAGEWVEARRWFTTVVERFGHTSSLRVEALYWAGRCAERVGERAAAVELYRRTVAPNRWDYFAQAAMARLATLESGPASPPDVAFRLVTTATPLAEPRPTPALSRALLFASLGLDAIARNEITDLLRHVPLEPPERLPYIVLLSELGDHQAALAELHRYYGSALIRGEQDLPPAFWRAAYPLPRRGLLEAEARQYHLDPYLLAALITQESGHNPKAYSPAGAHGLMQLLWSTAQRMAREVNLPLQRPKELFDPAVNLRLGSRYLADLLERFDGDTAAALAAYNAGEHRVEEWRLQGPRETPEFIATVPFSETQRYVERVLSHHRAYQAIYGEGAATPDPGGPG